MRGMFLFVLSFFSMGISKNITSSYILMDMSSKRVLEGQNIHQRFLTASIAKTLTAFVAINEGNLDDEIDITEESINQIGSKVYLRLGEKITLRDLLYGLLLRSGNDCAYLISVMIGGSPEGFAFLMNEYAKIIGMENSTFENASGLDEETKNYSSAYDMGLLISKAYENDIFKEIFKTKVYKNNNYIFYNKHKLLGLENITGGKTGYTKLAQRTLVTTAENKGKKIVCVTFKNSNDWNFHRTMLKKGLSQYQETTIFAKQKIGVPYNVSYYFEIKQKVSCLMKKEERIKLIVFVDLDKKEGELHIYIDDEYAFKIEMYECAIIDD